MKESDETVPAGHTRFLLLAVLLAGILGSTTTAHAYYHPTLGRFVQRDREEYADGMNLYQYVGSRPTVASDPDGRILIVLSGLGQHYNSGRSLGKSVALAIAHRVWRYDTSREKFVTVRMALAGMGGQQEENNLRKVWREFVARKKKNPCSLEQFVAIGHSDGATAMFRLVNKGTFTEEDWAPAYLGFVDLVRLDYGIGTVNTEGSADPRSHVRLKQKPQKTFVQNFWQEHGAGPEWLGFWPGWKGRVIDNANSNINVGALTRMLRGEKLNHFSLWKYWRLHKYLAKHAAKYYEKAVVAEMVAGKTAWARKEGETW